MLLGMITGLAVPGPARSQAVAPVVTSGALRILIVGDSVTQGAAGDWTWRYRLWQLLQDAGVAVDFVGPRTDLWDLQAGGPGATSYADPAFDQDHAARWGMRIAALDIPITDLVATYTPDVVITMLGVNDLLDGREPAAVAADVAAFVESARSVRPGVAVVLGEATQHWFPGVIDFNAALAALASGASTTTSPLVLARTAAGYDAAVDTWDHSHPNANGEVKIASAVAAALRVLGIGVPAPPPTPTPAPALAAPTDVRSAAGRRCARLAWRPVIGATSYWIQRRVDGHWTRGVRTTGVRVTLVRLPLQRSWRFRIRAVRGSSVGPQAAITVRRRATGRC